MEQVKGIEPSCSAWEADILPLNYTCTLPKNTYTIPHITPFGKGEFEKPDRGSLSGFQVSSTQVRFSHLVAGHQLRSSAAEGDPAGLQDVGPVRHGERRLGVLLHQ